MIIIITVISSVNVSHLLLIMTKLLSFIIALCTDGGIELYNGIGNMNGIVRYCINGTWNHLCGDENSTIDNNLASVICSELGHSPYG